MSLLRSIVGTRASPVFSFPDRLCLRWNLKVLWFRFHRALMRNTHAPIYGQGFSACTVWGNPKTNYSLLNVTLTLRIFYSQLTAIYIKTQGLRFPWLKSNALKVYQLFDRTYPVHTVMITRIELDYLLNRTRSPGMAWYSRKGSVPRLIKRTFTSTPS